MKKIILLLGCIALINLTNSCSKKEHDTFSMLYGVVTDHETGEPIANATIVLSPGGKTKTTGTDGTYQFNDIDAHQYTITVQKTGYSTNRKTVTAVVGEKTEANIPLTKN
ncbi:carboxypeptidase-like regulatory domain-containing protein [Bacteroides sp. 519]|uniref:carboxypeptidase-like regulatory domain-containing protein n=1 Tax=Bacteroides sp. 519 TaxID=2302937 RepID=UPI0013D36DC6|nr:carboxypeptidase-like regulatory domain-containing protein [Bacteroides sp. 519]NDV59253.1 carboxypeptidase regulatory-like domain-containing protein [Bacteroides sp. 519]